MPKQGKQTAIKSKEARIRAEKERLAELYVNIEPRKKDTVRGLIEEAAYMYVTLQDLKADLDRNGFTELFQQGRDQTPYDRKRPTAEIYQNMSNSYQKIIKQLTDLIPKDAPQPAADDGFDSFVEGREDD